MSRPSTKEDLMKESKQKFDKLFQVFDAMKKEELDTPFDFSKETSKKEAHWQRDKNPKDIFIHLYEWHQLLYHWVTLNQKGEEVSFFPKPYNWKTYGTLNLIFWKKHQKTSLEEAKSMLLTSHADIMKLADTFTDEELFTKKYYKWVGTSALGSYFVSATASHYEWALKKLKAHQKNVQRKENSYANI